ncbi:hypothetical protein [Anatilimnocola floriformis]|uniref:hypothetical protein n=1 Tax=Anatilimnocola floriformis TaxID=2948575 RepID=UPI0020C4C564|nr:hypothetical protein [Anatilimnocola floriformis]
MRFFACWFGLLLIGLVAFDVQAQTADDITKLIGQLVELDSIDVAKDIKFRAGLEPPLHQLDADESGMQVLKNPYEVQGRNQPAAAGWYRVSFTVPEQIGKFPMPVQGFNLGVESNCLGTWEIYTYSNGKSVGSSMANGASGTWQQGTVIGNSRVHSSYWMSNAPIPSKPGDKITVAILAHANPLGRGGPEGFGLRHLRLRFALAHTFARQPFFGLVTAPGTGTGLQGAREMLSTLKGDELSALQGKLKMPLENMSAVFAAADTGKLDELTKAMRTSTAEMAAALKK